MIRKLLKLIQVSLLLVGLAAGLAAWLVHDAIEQPLALDEERLLEVSAGATPYGVLNRLETDKVLHGAFWLRVWWRFNVEGQGLHSGEYRMTPGMGVRDLFGLWQRGEVVQYSVTLVEGWNFRQVRAALAKQVKLDQTLAGLSDSDVMKKLGHPDEFPEGRFFPDTYRYVRGMRDIDLLKQSYARLQDVLSEEWEKRSPDAPYENAYKALIMASVIEKETGVPQERAQIAGVFVRRLQQGMLLQTDPTVIYGLGERYSGKLTKAMLKDPSPYNTYLNAGLPPTPIAMVGRESIHAALNPASGDALYFVARGDGSHEFNSDLNAHNAAVREFQLKRKADYRSSPAPIVIPGTTPATPAVPDAVTPPPASVPSPAPGPASDGQPGNTDSHKDNS